MRNYFVFRFFLRSIMAFVFCSIGITKTVAQEERAEYVPFVEEGKVWYCGEGRSHVTESITPKYPEGKGIVCVFTMRGDTLINSLEYKKVYCQYDDYYGDEEQHYYCAIREEAYQVYIVEGESKEEQLLYDFSCPEEIITLTYNDLKFARTAGYSRVGFLPGQVMYEVCIYSGDEIDYSNSPGFYVDGVGGAESNPFAFEFSKYLFSQPKFGKYIYVLTCMKDGEYIFNWEWMGQPVTSINDKAHTNTHPKDSPLYNLQGQRLTDKPQNGIYIQNGKKVVVK